MSNNIALIILALVSAPAAAAPASYTVTPDSKELDAGRIRPYEAHWKQLARSEGELEETGMRFHEKLESDGETLRHVQSVLRDGDALITETRILTRDSLVPIKVRREADSPPEGRAKRVRIELEDLTYTGSKIWADGSSEAFEHAIDQPSFDGWIAGLVLAALPLELGYEARLPTVVHLQQTNFRLIARVSDERMFARGGGAAIPVWVVDTDWVDLGTGSVSKGGPEEAGGTYLIAKSPSRSIPYVIEYANSYGVIRWAE